MEGVHIRHATAGDIRKMSHLMVCLTEKYITLGLADDVKAKVLASFSVDGLVKAFSEQCDYFVAVADKRIVGVIGMKETSHLYHLFVAEAFQGRGLANQLWQVAKKNALNMQNLTHFTVNSAVSAQTVYKNWGFRVINGVRTREGFSDVPMKLDLV
ncbi:GNAT family N-acetyltransferase [uncultured Shewanella sp.]|uniref:GNAT family N-acetyltransferase n=1 Tax=uncultured Shewanella sp. TaxID=173975 RepID=UPI00262CE1D4|nr:GNAT family N-acetyltransferase [uncultured Shewanella sp.]